MAKQTLVQSRFYGGISEDEKEGVKNSFFFGRSLDYRTKPSVLKILPETVKESGSTVVDLIKWFENVGTDLYASGDAGNFYKRTSGGSWSLIAQRGDTNGQGLAYFPYDDFIYISTTNNIDRYGPIGNSPSLINDYLNTDLITLDQFLDSSGSTYTLPNAISEAAVDRQTFFPQVDPQILIEVNVENTGEQDWDIIVHDIANVQVATTTIGSQQMSTGDTKFTFAQWTPIVGAEYHFHVLTDSLSEARIVSSVSNDLETADFHTYYQILKTDALYHPVLPFLDFIAFGNGPYIATYNGFAREFGSTVYKPNRLALFKGWKARDMVKVGEYMAILAWKGDTITEFDEGMIYFWDGFSDSPNFWLNVTDGAVCAMAVEKKILYYITSAGSLYAWNGETQKLKTFPKMTLQTFVDIFPGAFTTWRGMPMIGFAGDSDSTTIEKGVYSYGRLNEKYPNSLNYDYPISSGTRTGTGLDIGAVGRTGDTLFVAWKDSSTYGVDKVDNSADPFATAIMESMIFDNGRPDKQKSAYTIKVTHKALGTGQSVQIGYDIDRSGSFTNGTANTTSNSTETVFQVNRKKARFYEIQFKLTLAATTTNPEILSVSFLFDDNEDEKIFGKKA